MASMRIRASWLIALALGVAACSTTDPLPTPEPLPSSTPAPIATVVPAADLGAAAAYSEAICPIFLSILDVEPALAAMRADGLEPAEILTDAETVIEVTGAIAVITRDLDRLPAWEPGRLLELELITAMHGLRVSLAGIADGLEAPDAATLLAALPYIASDRMDQAMVRAATGGLDCEGFE
jgi:hypothetical protein